MRDKTAWIALHAAFSDHAGQMRDALLEARQVALRLQEHGDEEIARIALDIFLRGRHGALHQELEDRQVNIVAMSDSGYPEKLKRLLSPPPVLYAMGDVSIANQPAVGICGSRAASEDGLHFARAFGLEAAQLGLVVISGAARGVDTEAHGGAIERDGKSVLVLAEGIAKYRMPRRLKPGETSLDNTLLMSQFYPEHTWQVSRAMCRNATICGLADAMIVVEAGETGGTLAAGRECIRQGKRLIVVNRSNPSKRAPGNTLLIEEGGEPVQSTDELKAMLSEVSASFGCWAKYSDSSPIGEVGFQLALREDAAEYAT